jgi:cytochrome c oxidase assembly protein subunit 15
MANHEAGARDPRRFLTLAWIVLLGTVVVVLSGDVVQATGSGAGCGESWPRCDGALLPGFEDAATAIEFSHRALTFVLSVSVIGLLIMARRRFAVGHHVRRAAAWAGVFFGLEVAIGAVLVAFGWVENDASVGRVVADALHVLNTFFLVGALLLVVLYASGGKQLPERFPLRGNRFLLSGVVVLIGVAVTGAVNSLADTLFPADSVLEGVREEFGAAAPFLLRIRAVHPAVAIAGGFAVYAIVRMVARDNAEASPAAKVVYALIATQFVVGVLNIALLTPLEVQVLHLLLAQALWISFLILAFRVLSSAPRLPARIDFERALLS